MKNFKKYSIFILLILIIIANLFFVNREGLNSPDVSNNYIIPTFSPNTKAPVLPTNIPLNIPAATLSPPVLPSLPNKISTAPVNQPVSQPVTEYIPPPITQPVTESIPQPMPASSSVGSYAMVCSNDADCDRYPTSEYTFKGSIDKNGITINKEKTYSCQNGVCIKN